MFSRFRREDEERGSRQDEVLAERAAPQREAGGKEGLERPAERDSQPTPEPVEALSEDLGREDAVSDGPASPGSLPDQETLPEEEGGSVPDSLKVSADPEALDEEAGRDFEGGLETDGPVDALDDSAVRPRKFVASGKPRRRASNQPLKASELKRGTFTPQQRLLLLDTWQRSGLPAGDFSDLVGVSKHTLYKWKQLFEKHGPEGVMDPQRRPRRGSRLPEVTKRTILMLKEAHPDWGCQRISDMLVRGPGLSASPQAVSRVLKEAGYESVSQPTQPHRQPSRRFERAAPNELWQTDLFTFMLKRQNRRLYLVAFMDDHSRFMVSYGVHATASTALVLDVLEAGIANYGAPKEVLTDNGPQYKTWRGKSRFTRHLEKRGIEQIVARPKRPQTLGKIERFWGTLWRELLEGAVFLDLADARRRIGLYLDYYNFQRTHHGCDGLVPADRFFAAAEPVRQALAARVSANALELARRGQPTQSFYVAGQVSGQPFSVHAEGERLVLQRDGGEREEVELTRPAEPKREEESFEPVCPHAAPPSMDGEPAEQPPLPPGASVLDETLDQSEPSPTEPEGSPTLAEASKPQEEQGGEA